LGGGVGAPKQEYDEYKSRGLKGILEIKTVAENSRKGETGVKKRVKSPRK